MKVSSSTDWTSVLFFAEVKEILDKKCTSAVPWSHMKMDFAMHARTKE